MKNQATKIWEEYERGKNILMQKQIYSRFDTCHEFVKGDQWKNLRVPQGMQRPPQLNILYPMMKNQTALVGQNTMDITFSPLNKTVNKDKYIIMCQELNRFVADTWENLKMDASCWNILEDAYITGDALAYFYWQEEEIKLELLDCINVIFADESNPDIQSQPYILIPQRKYIKDIKQRARENGLSHKDIEQIIPDEDMVASHQNQENLKATVITKMYKSDGVVHISRSTRLLEYEKSTPLVSKSRTDIGKISIYPIVKYSWKPMKGSARGVGEVIDKIPNQIDINKNLYRFGQVVKGYAFPHKVFLSSVLSKESAARLDYPGSSIEIKSAPNQNIDGVIKYLQPANISPYAATIWQDLIRLTRELAGSGDNLENINPEKASGAAINAARQAKTLNVNSQVAAYKQFIEDIAIIWAVLWQVYNKEEIVTDNMKISPIEFINLKPCVKIDVSPNNPFSKLAQDLELKELMAAGHITFLEYLDLLSDSSSLPREKIKNVINKRNLKISLPKGDR